MSNRHARPRRLAVADDPKRRIAYHEAGHALACHRLFPGVHGDLTVVPDHAKEIAGFHKSVGVPADNVEDMEKQTLYALAGYAACVAVGMEDRTARIGCGSDFELAEQIIAKWGLVPLQDHMWKAIDFMRRPENLRVVRRLADELLTRGTMDGEYVDLLIRLVDAGTHEAEAELEIYRINRGLV